MIDALLCCGLGIKKLYLMDKQAYRQAYSIILTQDGASRASNKASPYHRAYSQNPRISDNHKQIATQ